MWNGMKYIHFQHTNNAGLLVPIKGMLSQDSRRHCALWEFAFFSFYKWLNSILVQSASVSKHIKSNKGYKLEKDDGTGVVWWQVPSGNGAPWCPTSLWSKINLFSLLSSNVNQMSTDWRKSSVTGLLSYSSHSSFGLCGFFNAADEWTFRGWVIIKLSNTFNHLSCLPLPLFYPIFFHSFSFCL